MMRVLAVIASLLLSSCCATSNFCDERTTDTIQCSLSTLYSARVNSSRPDEIVHLDIECSDRQFFHESLDMSFLRQFSGLRSLSISHCQLGGIRPDALRMFPELRRLSVRTFNTEYLSEQLRLEQGCFDGLFQLENLDLSENNLWSLQPGSLSSLTSLKVLNLSGNSFQDMTDLRAAGLSRGLQVLDLSRNSLLEVPVAGFGDVPALKELHLSSNQLQLLQDGALRGLTSLGLLDISYNQLVALPAMLLNETRQLRQLQMHNNSISVLPPGLLADMPHLQTVNMSSNRLTSQWIRKDTFAGMFRLIVLDLSSNMLDDLNQDVFDDLSSLQVLDLSHNQLQRLPSGLFAALSNLHTLSLSGNGLTQLQQHTLMGLDVLSRLRLDSNRLTSLDDQVFVNVTGIQQLFLANNQLSRFPPALSLLTSLHQLDLTGNLISSVSGEELKTLKQMTYLQLARNRLSNFSARVLDNQNALTLLDLSGNEIDVVEGGAFDKASNLRAIRLDANRLRNINGLFAKLPALVWLNVSDNQIEFFDYALIPGALRWLDLHKNQLREIGNFYNIESNIELETLDISHNQVSLITRASVPDGIKYFIMASNQLATVESGTFEAKYQLVRADLSGNQLSELDLTAITLSADVKDNGGPEAELLLAGNPFFCDCSMDWLLTIDRMTPARRYPTVLDRERIMCRLLHSPHSLTPLPKTKPNDFLCTYERHCFALCHCCNFVACDCEMKCPDGCTCYRDHTWNTNIVDCSHREQVAISREIPMDATAVFADGNNIHSIDSHTFIGRKRIRHLYVNSSNVQEIQNRSLNGLSSLQVLRLENNMLTDIHDYEFESLVSLRELYLHNNQLRRLHAAAFSRLRSLEVLTLSGNQLTTWPAWQLASSPYLVQITLADNLWSCACDHRAPLTAFLRDSGPKVEDASKITCAPTGPDVSDCGDGLATAAVRGASSTRLLPALLLSAAALAVAAVAACLVLRYRATCRRRRGTAAKPGYLSSVASVATDADMLYDVFVTYSAQDTRFVNEVLTAELEQAAPAHRLCLLRRDAPNTSYLGDAVHHCVTTSSKTLIVVSRNFLDNEWCRFDFKASHLDALRSSRDIVVLLYGVERSAVEGELRALLKGAACVTYGEPDCWRKLRSVLRPRRGFKGTLPHSISDQSSMFYRDSRLLQTMLQGDSPSPTCSTGVSDDCPVHFRSDSDNPLVSNAAPLHNSSYSEHTYMSIDQYQAVPPTAPDRQLYSTLEPEVEPQMPSDPCHPVFRGQRSLTREPGYQHVPASYPQLPPQRPLLSGYPPLPLQASQQDQPRCLQSEGEQAEHYHQRSLSHSLWV